MIGWLALFLVAVSAAAASAQTVMTVDVAGDALRVKAPAFAIVEGQTLERLKDGRSVRVDIELTVLSGPGGRQITHTRRTFDLSFDIWEERFVVTRTGTPARSISLARPADADAWCLENVALPIAALGTYGRSTPLWVKLAYRAHDPTSTADAEAEEGFTLRALIDKLSRKQTDPETSKSIEAGPFRLN